MSTHWFVSVRRSTLQVRADISKHVSNLCSAFSYCLTLLGTCYVWHGKGSLPRERQAALGYARSLSAEGTHPVELVERESDDNEMFWMLLGDAVDYANADYWKWRPTSVTVLPRIWRVDALSPPYVRETILVVILPALIAIIARGRPGTLYPTKYQPICVPH
jgi:hypothetical protein